LITKQFEWKKIRIEVVKKHFFFFFNAIKIILSRYPYTINLRKIVENDGDYIIG